MILALLSRFIHWGQGLVTGAHLENNYGICCEDLNATYKVRHSCLA